MIKGQTFGGNGKIEHEEGFLNCTFEGNQIASGSKFISCKFSGNAQSINKDADHENCEFYGNGKGNENASYDAKCKFSTRFNPKRMESAGAVGGDYRFGDIHVETNVSAPFIREYSYSGRNTKIEIRNVGHNIGNVAGTVDCGSIYVNASSSLKYTSQPYTEKTTHDVNAQSSQPKKTATKSSWVNFFSK